MIPLLACSGPSREPDGPDGSLVPSGSTSVTGTTATTGSTGATGTTGDSGVQPCGTLSWAQRFGGTGKDSVDGLDRLPDGGFVVVGAFEYSMTLAAGTPQEVTLVSAAGAERNAFLAAHDADGTLRWARVGESSGTVLPADVAVGSDGSIAVAGHRETSVTFGSLSLADHVSSDGFLVVYSATGDALWIAGPEGSSLDDATGVAVAPDASVVLTGVFSDLLTFPDGSQLTSTEGLGGPNDGYVARYLPDGTFVWARHIYGLDLQEPDAVAATVDAIGVVGTFVGEVSFSGGLPTTLAPTVNPAGTSVLFVAQWDGAGGLQWARSDGGGGGSEFPKRLRPTTTGWSLFGYTGRDAVFGEGEATELAMPGPSWSAYVVDYIGATGAFGGGAVLLDGDGTTSLMPYDGVVGGDGEIGLAGYVAGKKVVLGEGTQRVTALTPGASREPFVGTWDAAYAFQCTWPLQSDSGATDEVDGVAFDQLGGIWVAGTFGNTLTLAPGSAEETTLTTAGETDVFLARFLLEAP